MNNMVLTGICQGKEAVDAGNLAVREFGTPQLQ